MDNPVAEWERKAAAVRSRATVGMLAEVLFVFLPLIVMGMVFLVLRKDSRHFWRSGVVICSCGSVWTGSCKA